AGRKRMKTMHGLILIALTAAPLAAAAQDAAGGKPATDFATFEAQMGAANGKAGPRTVPGRSIAVPDTASARLQASIAAPYRIGAWNANPRNAAEWKELIGKNAAAGTALRQQAREKLGVTIEPTVLGGVKAFIVTPKEIAPANRNRLLFHVHGGGYVFGPGES